MAALDALTPEAREVAITGMLDQARTWLAHAVESTAPAQDIAQFRQFIATAAETARRLKVSKDIRQDAEVMVRRSERALGQAIRHGQEAGSLATPRTARKLSISGAEIDSTASFFGGGAEQSSVYAMTDGVTDEEFNIAIELAQEEQNVSRANVVRKVREVAGSGTNPLRERWERIAALAADGFSSRQIAEMVDITREGLTRGAAQRGITFPADAVVGKTRRLDSNRILSGVTDSIAAAAFSLQQVNPLDLDRDEALEQVDSLTESITALRKAVRTIKESLS